MHKILLVDDDRDLCDMLHGYLTTDGFQCDQCFDGLSGLQSALNEPYDAIVLDVMMPGLNGFDLLRRLREKRKTPVIMLTARGEEMDSIVGLEIGADDYLAKPCSPQVLAAHLRAVLRRTSGQRIRAVDESITVGDVTLHPGSLQVTVSGKKIELTNAEFNILQLLMQDAGEAIAKEVLSKQGLGRKLTAYDRSIDIHISNLRRKLKPDPLGNPRICTVRGTGYLYSLPSEI